VQALVEWLDQWQTLVGSFLGALAGAAAALVAVFMSRWFRELNASRYLQAELARLERAYTPPTGLSWDQLIGSRRKSGPRLRELFLTMAAEVMADDDILATRLTLVWTNVEALESYLNMLGEAGMGGTRKKDLQIHISWRMYWLVEDARAAMVLLKNLFPAWGFVHISDFQAGRDREAEREQLRTRGEAETADYPPLPQTEDQ